MQSFETSGTIAGINSTKPPSSGASNVSEPRLTSQVGSAQSYARRSVCFCNKSGGSASNVLHAYQLKSCEWASTAMSVVRLALRIVVHRLTSKMSQIFCVYFMASYKRGIWFKYYEDFIQRWSWFISKYCSGNRQEGGQTHQKTLRNPTVNLRAQVINTNFEI